MRIYSDNAYLSRDSAIDRCRGLADMDRRGNLAYYFKPPLDLTESRRPMLEGWIPGVS